MTREQMHEYGYLWDGMTPLTKEEAIEAYKGGSGDVFRLYEDNTEGLVVSITEIIEHAECGGIFGLEQWATYPYTCQQSVGVVDARNP